jgi:hypothetical protein
LSRELRFRARLYREFLHSLDRDETRNFEEGSNAARIIVGARAAAHRIVMGADDQDLLRPGAAGPRGFEIGAGLPCRLVPLLADLITLLAPFRCDVLSGGRQRRGPEHVALANPAGEAFDMAPDALCGLAVRPAHDSDGAAVQGGQGIPTHQIHSTISACSHE